MADQKVSDLPSLNGADVDAADLLYIIDSSAGTAGSKKITVGQYQLAPYSAGTANGVMYLNGSNAVTTGSGLVFDGTNLGVGTSSPGEKLAINQGNIYAVRTGGAKVRLADQNNEVSVESLPTGGASNMVFKTSTATQMTLDSSGNLGLGVTPSAWTSTYKAFAAGSVNSNFSGFWDGTTAITTVATGGAVIGGSWTYTMSGQAVTRYAQTGGGAHAWYTAPSGTAGNAISFTQAMTLDASGNLGLGVTPSAWTSTYKALDVQVNSALYSHAGGGQSGHASNAFFNGTNWIYKTSNNAGRYEQNTIGGAHAWYTAPSGTAGNAITFTQAMTLDASGNLGVGTSSPGARLDVTDGTTAGQITSWFTKGNSDPAFRLGFSNGSGSAVNTEQGALVFAYVGTDVLAKIGFLRGSTSDCSGITFNIGGTGGGTERARITSGGDLLVGTTTLAGAGGLTFQKATDTVAIVSNSNAAPSGNVMQSFRRSGVEIGSITQNGTTAVLFNTTSDRRLKDNIVPAPSASDVIDAIEIVSHDWKAAPDEHVTYGVIAQDLHAVAPQAVLQGDDGEEIEKTWGVDYSKLVPMLIKEIQSLRARVAALEAQ